MRQQDLQSVSTLLLQFFLKLGSAVNYDNLEFKLFMSFLFNFLY